LWSGPSGREAGETISSAGRIDLYITKALPPAAHSHREQIGDVLNFSVGEFALKDPAFQSPSSVLSLRRGTEMRERFVQAIIVKADEPG
jgi:hypothetical protein